MFTLSLSFSVCLFFSSHNCVRSKQARARVCTTFVKKGKKIGFALCLSLSLSLSRHRSRLILAHSLLLEVCFVSWLCVCDANGMKTAEIYSVALTFFFFLQQNSVICFL